MLNPNDFNPELHLTIVLLSVAATLGGMCVYRFIMSSRDRATSLEKALISIHQQEAHNEEQFKRQVGNMNALVNDIQTDATRNYDQVVLTDLTSHETRIIEAAQDSLNRSQKVGQSVHRSKQVDDETKRTLPQNKASLQSVEDNIVNLVPLVGEFKQELETTASQSPFANSQQSLERSERAHAKLSQAVKALRRVHLGIE